MGFGIRLLHCLINIIGLLKCSLEVVYVKVYTLFYNVKHFSRIINKPDFNYKENDVSLHGALSGCFRWIKVKIWEYHENALADLPSQEASMMVHAMPPTSSSQPVIWQGKFAKNSFIPGRPRTLLTADLGLRTLGGFAKTSLDCTAVQDALPNLLFLSPSFGVWLASCLPAFSSPLPIFSHRDTPLNKTLCV